MKIKKEDIRKYLKVFKDIPYEPVGDRNDLIVFPIDNTKVVENNGFEFQVKGTTAGVAKDPEPILILMKDDQAVLGTVGYADLTYGRKLSIKDYTSLMDCKVTKGISELDGYECYLLQKDYIFAMFNYK
jgi:hypothetical protein